MISAPYGHSSQSDTAWHEVSVAHWCRELNVTRRNMTKLCLIFKEAYVIVSKQKNLTLLYFLFCTWPVRNLKLVYDSATTSFGGISVFFPGTWHMPAPLFKAQYSHFLTLFSFSFSLFFLCFCTPGFRKHRCMDNPGVPAEETRPL